jgi:hypothetical protein
VKSIACADGLKVSAVPAPPQGADVVIRAVAQDRAGVTSVRFKANKKMKDGYLERDRDLGQTFTAPQRPMRLTAVTLRTGPVKGSVRPGALGAKVSLELFRVDGTPRIDDNGTTKVSTNATWTNDPRADDNLIGETYTPLCVASGGTLPKDLTTDQYLRFELCGPCRIVLEPGKRYAFLVMFDEPREDESFTLANLYWGKYEGGHGIRREGSPGEPWQNHSWLPLDWKTRIMQPPGTFGRPDVDTWRDLVFFLEAEPVEK